MTVKGATVLSWSRKKNKKMDALVYVAKRRKQRSALQSTNLIKLEAWQKRYGLQVKLLCLEPNAIPKRGEHCHNEAQVSEPASAVQCRGEFCCPAQCDHNESSSTDPKFEQGCHVRRQPRNINEVAAIQPNLVDVGRGEKFKI